MPARSTRWRSPRRSSTIAIGRGLWGDHRWARFGASRRPTAIVNAWIGWRRTKADLSVRSCCTRSGARSSSRRRAERTDEFGQIPTSTSPGRFITSPVPAAKVWECSAGRCRTRWSSCERQGASQLQPRSRMIPMFVSRRDEIGLLDGQLSGTRPLARMETQEGFDAQKNQQAADQKGKRHPPGTRENVPDGRGSRMVRRRMEPRGARQSSPPLCAWGRSRGRLDLYRPRHAAASPGRHCSGLRL
jgi:hypothetical protein